jgi:pyrimidine deaminase RibD-like protein
MGTRAMKARAKKATTTTKPNFVVGFVYLLGTTTTTTTTTTHAMVWATNCCTQRTRVSDVF